jgi:ABC-type uncharacterized transport system ATPase subunit
MDTVHRRRIVVLLSVVMLLTTTIWRGMTDGQSGTLRFGVGPLQPTPAEPVASLDPESSATVLESLRSAVATGVAVVASLHQVHLARSYADRILALREGRVVADAPTARLDVRSIEQIYERAAGRA